MTRKQLERAAKIYSLAMLAHLDGDPDDTANPDASEKVMRLASKRAQTKLRNMKISFSEVVGIDDAIDLAVAGR